MKSRLTRSGGWLAARPAARVRKNSDFPEPVVPATRKCGPSAFRSICRVPGLPAPTAVPSPASAPVRDQRREMSGAARGRTSARLQCRGMDGGGASGVRRVALKPRQKRSKTTAGTRSGTKSRGGAPAVMRVLRRPRTMPGCSPGPCSGEHSITLHPCAAARVRNAGPAPALSGPGEAPDCAGSVPKDEDSAVESLARPRTARPPDPGRPDRHCRECRRDRQPTGPRWWRHLRTT